MRAGYNSACETEWHLLHQMMYIRGICALCKRVWQVEIIKKPSVEVKKVNKTKSVSEFYFLYLEVQREAWLEYTRRLASAAAAAADLTSNYFIH